MKILGYIWRVLTNLFYLAVVMYALASLKGRLEMLVISTLGMIYVTIRSIAGGQFIAMLGTAAATQVQLEAIRARLDGTFDPAPTQDFEDAQRTWTVKWMIDVAFLAIISLLCIFTFFTGLSR